MGVTVDGEEPLFVGREEELRCLADCASRTRSGEPWVVLVEGVAGVGKTALLRRWLAGEDGRDGTLLRAFGDASESDLSFGLIGQLIAPVPRARRESFPLLREGAPSARASSVHVGGQLLGLLDDLQDGEGPVALIVEDVHWADRASLQALGFVLRRLEADQVLTVFTTRSPAPEEILKLVMDRPWGLHLTLTGLDEEPIARLIRHTTGHQATARVVSRLREHTDGNPLYLSTLLAELPAGLLLQPPANGMSWPVPASLAAAVRRQLDALPAPSRALVEAAAVLDRRMPLSGAARLADVDDPATALQPALAANLLRWWPTEPTTPIMIAHALQRDAVIEALGPGRRRRLHHQAADLVDDAASWRHRVSAARGPDDHLAQQLEEAAERCLAAGATERATTLLLWASDLATTRPERERHLLTAAARLLPVTQVARLQQLLPRIQACSATPLRSVALGTCAMLNGGLEEAEAELTAAFEATRDRPADHWTAALAGTSLACTHLFRGEAEAVVRVSQQVLGLDEPADYVARGFLADGRSYLDGPSAGLKALEELAPLPPAPQVTEADYFLLTYRGFTRMLCGMPTAAREDLTHVLRLNEGGVAHGLEELATLYLSVADYWTGAWDDGAMHADLALTTATTEQRLYSLAPACSYASWTAAGRGEARRAQELLRTAEQHVLPYNAGVVSIGWALEAQARADWPAMLDTVDRMLRTRPADLRIRQVFWKPLEVESLLRNGHLDRAAAALAELAAMAGTYPCLRLALAWLSGELARRRGDVPAAENHYRNGLALPAAPDDHVLHRAFLAHGYGQLLAATGQSGQARTWLKRALERYTALQALPFADRCRADLAAADGWTGTAAEAPVPPVLTGLTDRERDIARLVVQGLTNKEIGEHLFISGKTVEYHLGNIYGKLHLTNRRQLRDHMWQRTR
ncbi:LuxR family transcriptional regulator [Streptomyces sp. TRM64462]|uniref:helix-turn-helix transcriptional regulator n=1 Tax=Streptomyces sp. TRM64462 TaxID=2741726 RepID=UPI001586EF44|nr:LuxR family transcriptional regulator [Streptomyces sp. TRM64462]